MAIKALYYFAMQQAGNVEELFNRARRDLVRNVLADLNDRNLMILRGVEQTDEPFVKTVYKR